MARATQYAPIRPGWAWGRRLAQQTGLPEDIRLWQEEDALLALSQQVSENLGGWLVGEGSYRNGFETPLPQPIQTAEKLFVYREMANGALTGDIVGSLAGGEQPKFTCYMPNCWLRRELNLRHYV